MSFYKCSFLNFLLCSANIRPEKLKPTDTPGRQPKSGAHMVVTCLFVFQFTFSDLFYVDFTHFLFEFLSVFFHLASKNTPQEYSLPKREICIDPT